MQKGRKFLRLALPFLALSLVLGALYAGAQQSVTETPAATAPQARTTVDEAPAAVEQQALPAEAPGQQARAVRADSDAAKTGDDDIRAQRSKSRVLGMRAITQAQRAAAAERAKARRTEAERRGLVQRAPVGGVGGIVPTGAALYFGQYPNFAGSALPTQTVVGGPITGGIRKFVDSLPGLGAANCVKGAPADPNSCHENNLGNYIPVVKPATGPTGGYTSFGRPDDYYEIGLKDYMQQMHTDLPPTSLRGYYDKSSGDTQPHYLGPVIIAKMNKPVRLKFTNELLTTSHLQLPLDFSAMGAGLGPDGTPYSQNRAVIHLHGGATPWISDGTPHQWITPKGDSSNFKKGVSFQNVPDMVGLGKAVSVPAPGDGVGTYYYTNQQSNRFMFFHDHSYGTTRLNVYAGEAAGYVLWDQWEKDLIEGTNVGDSVAPGGTPVKINAAGVKVLPGIGAGVYEFGIPLVIQDKTFVPPVAQLQMQDPTWDTTLWGSTGNLWFPHVYMPNQNPADIEGVNAMGRWDYGPWFWPPQAPTSLKGVPPACGIDPLTQQTIYCPGTPQVTQVPESFSDTPVVNGAAYPYLTVQPQAYRFRILNAANDRHFHLGIYYAADKTNNTVVCKGAGSPANCTEVSMVPAEPHAAVPVAPAVNTTPPGTATVPPPCLTAISVDQNGLATGALSGANVLNGTGMPASCWPSTWPTDGRAGGVPDPLTAGPAMIQIGTEAGWLPQPVVIPSTPVGYNYNRRDITVLNISTHGLLLGPAERADVIVDFSQVPAGSTLILYNDAPAPVPASDPRWDPFTGNDDMTSTGGPPSTLPGYGPNIRTIMQFRVAGASSAPYDVASLKPAMASYFKVAQPTPIVGNAAYQPVYDPSYSFATGAGAAPYASGYSRIQDNTLTWFPVNYATGAQSITRSASQTMLPKAIHELFDDWGRMNSLLGTELPFTNFQTQTTVPLYYVDPPTEILTDGQPQIWKITHNGVDTHAIHFHLFNVQVINRVGWDGAIRAPDSNEIGWKETVRMNPLEDAIVAFLPQKQLLPFAIPNSVRLLDPTMPTGLDNNMSGLDPVTGNAGTTTNASYDFGWEYVWHCHLLGHEENDMMRPMVLRVAASPVIPGAPTSLTATKVTGPPIAVNLAWTAPAGIPAATSYQVQRSVNGAGFSNLATTTAPTVAFQDTAVSGGQTYAYQVLAVSAGNLSVPSNTATVTFQLATPSPTATRLFTSGSVRVSWPAVPNATTYLVQRSTDPTFPATTVTSTTPVAAGTGNPVSLNVTGLVPGTNYYFRVQATNSVPAAASAFGVLPAPGYVTAP